MRFGRWMTGIGLGALCATGLVVAPALQAQERDQDQKPAVRLSPVGLRGMGSFTPAAADPKLAAVIARSGLNDSAFRFTPANAAVAEMRSFTVTVRSRSTRSSRDEVRNAPTQQAVNLAPIAYNLGVSVAWKRLAVSGDVTKVDLIDQPGGHEQTQLGLSYSGKRLSGQLKVTNDRPVVTTGAPALIGDKPSYSFDLGSSYSLSRNLDVTAGVRYKSERDRLPQLKDDRRDSQAIYIGTAFRF